MGDKNKKSDGKTDAKTEMPLGLSFGMAMNEEAMEHFAGMSKSEKKQLIEKARHIDSKANMDKLINDVADGKWKSF